MGWTREAVDRLGMICGPEMDVLWCGETVDVGICTGTYRHEPHKCDATYQPTDRSGNP